MIKPEKMPNALYALQSVLIKAREMAYQSASARDLGASLTMPKCSRVLLRAKKTRQTNSANTLRR